MVSHRPVFPAQWRQRQEGLEVKVILSYIVRLRLAWSRKSCPKREEMKTRSVKFTKVTTTSSFFVSARYFPAPTPKVLESKMWDNMSCNRWKF